MDSGWRLALCLYSGRDWCLVVNSSPEKMMIVDGRRKRLFGVTTDSVEECVVVQ